ncbi:hypothetical protein BDZ90DRAFT_215327 [Jaminaea rosea]|uniref:Lariat debranching enzyme C-terminal domain-containing protein n=1 Tax=Jaminaea rosea TaxID=1569628 RepID=A0A316V3I4_9BASI|nr:hypothetical protein BDZ90DRAFT_215327 [Jaminaea rosea]PWN30005.1 hypothetical protein BDZ90DRAFT_215327 [Jaminaea rosea]
MKIAVEGCSHGELDNIYASIAKAEEAGGFKTDLLLLCGDFQGIRNVGDLECIAVPPKYRSMGSFHRYYSGEKIAPVLTLVVGGNHEASNYMWELAHGGWLAPNIYFLGEAGAVDVNGVIIAGASGIYKSHDYTSGRHEQVPYSPSDIRSVYHTRIFDIWRLKLLANSRESASAGPSSRPDIVMSHDWPNTIEQHGDVHGLIKRKPFFKDEINTSTLGSPPLLELLKTLRPSYWFSAHLHVKFAALFKHGGQGTEVGPQGREGGAQAGPSNGGEASNPEAIDIDLDDSGEEDVDEEPKGANAAATDPTFQGASETRFLALSKCLPGHKFLQFFDMPSRQAEEVAGGSESVGGSSSKPQLCFVPRWLAILRATNHFLCLQKKQTPLPSVDDALLLKRIDEEEDWVRRELMAQGRNATLAVEPIQHFVRTAPSTSDPQGSMPGPPPWFTNPQTEALCHWLQMENKINAPPPMPPPHMMPPGFASQPGFDSPGGRQPQPLPGLSGAAVALHSSDERDAKRHKMEARGGGGGNEGPEQAENAGGDGGEPLRLDDEDEAGARWKEGTG